METEKPKLPIPAMVRLEPQVSRVVVGAPVGTVVCRVVVRMSDGSAFGGTLTVRVV